MPTITGISIKRFPKSNMEFAELSVLRAVEEVDNEKFQQTGIGFSTDIPYNKQALKIDVDYARQLIQTRAFVANREYELNFGANPNDPLDILVNKLVPTDAEIQKHFEASFKK
ncbi:VSK-int [Vibrio chagasii]|nr:VSK-int [Vibrio chagasii]CAH6813510.1 VSK-int [Vibrio chagasii]CAH6883291.1 VSK-int [Vibrio chagasii]CAH6900268.1 VSK-int [Vibrio chagasii]CAH6932590.1 VSK-int [Vibrio chagasii]